MSSWIYCDKRVHTVCLSCPSHYGSDRAPFCSEDCMLHIDLIEVWCQCCVMSVLWDVGTGSMWLRCRQASTSVALGYLSNFVYRKKLWYRGSSEKNMRMWWIQWNYRRTVQYYWCCCAWVWYQMVLSLSVCCMLNKSKQTWHKLVNGMLSACFSFVLFWPVCVCVCLCVDSPLHIRYPICLLLVWILSLKWHSMYFFCWSHAFKLQHVYMMEFNALHFNSMYKLLIQT